MKYEKKNYLLSIFKGLAKKSQSKSKFFNLLLTYILLFKRF